VEQGAAPAPGRHAGPGQCGAPPGGHYGPPARSWLKAARRKCTAPLKRGPHCKDPQWSAARRGLPRREIGLPATGGELVLRRAALHPLAFARTAEREPAANPGRTRRGSNHARPQESATMTKRSFAATKDADTRELLLDATNALARRMAEDLRMTGGAEHLDAIRLDLRAAADSLKQHDGPAANAQHRALCNALLLFHACPRAACRRARACHGRAETCLAQAAVPDAVFDHAVALMLSKLVPAAATLTGRRADGQLAYAAWVAAMEARR